MEETGAYLIESALHQLRDLGAEVGAEWGTESGRPLPERVKASVTEFLKILVDYCCLPNWFIKPLRKLTTH